MIDGFINIYKEQGYTSFDVVAKLRGILKQKKIGHTGTLDPMAEGVLLVCLGSATKMCDLLTEKNKTYTCTMLLGKTSDTEDVTGVMTDVTDVYPDENTVRAAVMSFVGDYMQIPPMYSAIKVNGKKLYELASSYYIDTCGDNISLSLNRLLLKISNSHILIHTDNTKTVSILTCRKLLYNNRNVRLLLYMVLKHLCEIKLIDTIA